MNIDIWDEQVNIGDRAVIDKGNHGGRHIRRADGEGVVYVTAGEEGTIKEILTKGWVVFLLDKSGTEVEVSIKNLFKIGNQMSEVQQIDIFDIIL